MVERLASGLSEHMEFEEKNPGKERATKAIVPKYAFIFPSNPWLDLRTKAKTETEPHKKCLRHISINLG